MVNYFEVIQLFEKKNIKPAFTEANFNLNAFPL